jgi:hypothetical protein
VDHRRSGKKNFFCVAILLLHYYHRGNMRQPDMAFVLCRTSSRLQAGSGCSGTQYRNIKTHISMRCRTFAGYHPYIQFLRKTPFWQEPILRY